MKVVIAGGDGFIGWPLSLRLSKLGYDVLIVDNLVRRKIDTDNGYFSITDIKPIEQRLEKWTQLTGKVIQFQKIDLANSSELDSVFSEFKPDVFYHLAEQKSAPFSMKNFETIDYTITNNTQATKNVLLAIMKFNPKCHLIHIGTMGVYGYGAVQGSEIPEGYCMAKLHCNHTDKCSCESTEIVHPYYPGSVYHMTKCLDNIMFINFQKYFGLKITDLHQGIVWGVSTPQTDADPALINRIDVDSDFGTVLNRFCSQVACGRPITVYGTGEQTRAFININDSIQCLLLALQSGVERTFSKVEIMNQMTATHKLNDLKDMLLQLYPEATVQYLLNPRAQKAGNSLDVRNDKFKTLGHTGIEVDRQGMRKIVEACKQNMNSLVKADKYINPISYWKKAEEMI